MPIPLDVLQVVVTHVAEEPSDSTADVIVIDHEIGRRVTQAAPARLLDNEGIERVAA